MLGVILLKLIITLEDESVFLSFFFKVRLRMPHVLKAETRCDKSQRHVAATSRLVCTVAATSRFSTAAWCKKMGKVCTFT